MLVKHHLDFPEVLVEEVGSAAVLEPYTGTGRVRENLEIPLLEGHVMVILPDILGVGQHKSTRQQQGQQELPKVFSHNVRFPHGKRGLVQVIRILNRHVVGVVAVSGATVLGVAG